MKNKVNKLKDVPLNTDTKGMEGLFEKSFLEKCNATELNLKDFKNKFKTLYSGDKTFVEEQRQLFRIDRNNKFDQDLYILKVFQEGYGEYFYVFFKNKETGTFENRFPSIHGGIDGIKEINKDFILVYYYKNVLKQFEGILYENNSEKSFSVFLESKSLNSLVKLTKEYIKDHN